VLSNHIAAIFKQAISAAIAAGELGALSAVPDEIAVEYPKNPEHGDRAISIAMKLTREAKIPPRAVAETIVKHLEAKSFTSVDIAGPGFINLRLSWQALGQALTELHGQGDGYGSSSREMGNDAKILVEYVSANPTGDLHIGHGRQAVYGSALVSLLKWAGYDVASEFYINDAGAQMLKLGESVGAAILIAEGLMAEKDYPEDAYPLESMREFVTREKYGDCFALRARNDVGASDRNDVRASDRNDDAIMEYAALGQKVFIEAQQETLAKIGVEFDRWFSENRELYSGAGANSQQETAVSRVCELLAKGGFTYEQDSALWFRATDLGDERDRVLRKSDGYYTYLAGDLAYHYDKLKRGYTQLINVWGADHHGQEPSLVAGLKAITQASGLSFNLEVPLIQMVSLQKGGVEYKMSKRSGNVVTVRDLYEEVGADAMRYFLVESQITNRMIFDLELATKQDKDNPVYYVQYAHARCCSILRTLTGEQINIGDAVTEPSKDKPRLSQAELDTMLSGFAKPNAIYEVFAGLDAEAASSTRKLVLALLSFPEEVQAAAQVRAPYKIANYLRELAGLYHQFYTHNRVIVDDPALMQARVSLVVATRIVLANALSLLGITAPVKM